jgi:hypothetical protein
LGVAVIFAPQLAKSVFSPPRVLRKMKISAPSAINYALEQEFATAIPIGTYFL